MDTPVGRVKTGDYILVETSLTKDHIKMTVPVRVSALHHSSQGVDFFLLPPVWKELVGPYITSYLRSKIGPEVTTLTEPRFNAIVKKAMKALTTVKRISSSKIIKKLHMKDGYNYNTGVPRGLLS
jgi:hypothetical protein